jgi:Family of unknown function (DUF5906)
MTSAPTPDFAASVASLKMALPLGPWQLTAIDPEKKKPPVTRTFRPGDDAYMLSWLDNNNGRNLYWAVNPPAHDASKKSEKKDIKTAGYLHADVDPAEKDAQGKHITLEQAQAIIRRKFVELPIGEGKHPPSFIIFSGNGYQLFWKLAEPLAVDGDPALIERYNIQRAKMFGGDNCHNIDRIMRLPGTVNWPNEQKRQKGRLPVLATVYSLSDPMPAYPLSLFMPSPKEVQSPAPPGRTVSIDVSNVARLGDINELDKWGVPDRVKVICVQGNHPEEPPKVEKRSGWLFDAVCNLLRTGVPDEVIYSIITDPEFGISESVVELGNNAEKYAIRQIERAKEEVVEPWLRKLNDRFFVVENDGSGRTMVVEVVQALQIDNTIRFEMTYQSFNNFYNLFMNEEIDIEAGKDAKGNPKFKTVEVGRWWLKHKLRRQLKQIVFRPDVTEPIIDGCYNLWRGLAIAEKQGEWPLLRLHIEKVLAAGDPECADFILKWTAYKLQYPHLMPQVALIFMGEPGCGKGTYGRAMASLFGQHGIQVTSAAHLAGRFNGHLRDVCFVFSDEAVMPNDEEAYKILKGMITEPTHIIEDKNVKVAPRIPNHIGVVMAVDRKRAIRLDPGDRRFASFEVSNERVGDFEYFKALNAEMENGGLAAMLYDLRHMPLGDWLPKAHIPDTAARNELKEEGLSETEKVFLDMLKEGDVPCHDLDLGAAFVSAARLHTYALKKLQKRGDQVTTVKIADLFKKLGFEYSDSARPRHWVIPPLPEARVAWAEAFMAVPWNEVAKWAPVNNRLQQWLLADEDCPF